MIELLRARVRHGYQAIPKPEEAKLPPLYRGFPILREGSAEQWLELMQTCPAGAIGLMSLDLGKCTLCGACARRQPELITWTPFHKTATSSREALIVTPGLTAEAYQQRAISPVRQYGKWFGKSLKLRSVSAGGCGACELELNATTNVNFDMGRYGIDIVASPRHADALVVTGPVSANMAFALEQTWIAIPEPKIIILAGACAISGGVFASSNDINRQWLDAQTVALYVPGCPPHPLNIMHGILGLLGRQR